MKPIDLLLKINQLRQKGKITELVLGCGGSVGALKAMGALEMGLAKDGCNRWSRLVDTPAPIL